MNKVLHKHRWERMVHGNMSAQYSTTGYRYCWPHGMEMDSTGTLHKLLALKRHSLRALGICIPNHHSSMAQPNLFTRRFEYMPY